MTLFEYKKLRKEKKSLDYEITVTNGLLKYYQENNLMVKCGEIQRKLSVLRLSMFKLTEQIDKEVFAWQ